jgi:hypothetical protein
MPMNAISDATHHSRETVEESAFARRTRLAAIGALGGLIGSMAGGAAFYAGPLGILLSMVAGAALLLTIGASRH